MPPRQRTKSEDPITPELMRALHAALKVHGIESDQAVHDYLTVVLNRPVTTRQDLTSGEARTALKDLDNTPRTPTPAAVRAARKPFPDDAIGKLPRSTCRDCSRAERKVCQNHTWIRRCDQCGNSHSSATIHLDYVGHADVTDRLLEVDPSWSWRPWTTEELLGLPPALREAGIWIHLTVCGVTRPGFGDGGTDAGGRAKTGPNAAKEAIGDALRNAAMRFGIALDLWAKGDREWAHADRDDATDKSGDADHRQAMPPETQLTTTDVLEQLDALARDAGTDRAGMTARWRKEHGNLSVDALPRVAPDELLTLVRAIEDWNAQQAAKAAQPAEARP